MALNCFVVSIFLLLNLFLGAPSAKASFCDCIARFLSFKCAPRSITEITHPAVLKWIAEKRANPFQHRFRKYGSGDAIIVGDHSYSVDVPLGGRGEGVVYMVKNGSSLEVVKDFFREGSMAQALKIMRTKWFAGFYWPEVFEVDEAKHVLRMQLIEGLPVSVVESDGLWLGLTQKQVDHILGKFYSKKIAHRPRSSGGWLDPSNVVYEFKTDRLYIVDPI